MSVEVAVAYLHILVGLCVSVANVLVIAAVWKFSYLQNRANMYITSLAYADGLMGIVEISFGVLNNPNFTSLYAHHIIICSAFSHAFYIVKTSALLHILLICIDRFLYIEKPYFYAAEVTETRVRIALGTAWMISIGFSSSVWILPHDPHRTCSIRGTVPFQYRVYVDIPMFYAVLIPVSVLYLIISKEALRHKRDILIQNYCDSAQTPARKKLRTVMHNIRTLKLFFVVCGLQFICWLPSQVADITMQYTQIPLIIYDITLLLACLNSGLDVIVYPCYNKEFRIAIKQMIYWPKSDTYDRRSSFNRSMSVSSIQDSRDPGSYLADFREQPRTQSRQTGTTFDPYTPEIGTCEVYGRTQGIIVIAEDWDDRAENTGTGVEPYHFPDHKLGTGRVRFKKAFLNVKNVLTWTLPDLKDGSDKVVDERKSPPSGSKMCKRKITVTNSLEDIWATLNKGCSIRTKQKGCKCKANKTNGNDIINSTRGTDCCMQSVQQGNASQECPTKSDRRICGKLSESEDSAASIQVDISRLGFVESGVKETCSQTSEPGSKQESHVSTTTELARK